MLRSAEAIEKALDEITLRRTSSVDAEHYVYYDDYVQIDLEEITNCVLCKIGVKGYARAHWLVFDNNSRETICDHCAYLVGEHLNGCALGCKFVHYKANCDMKDE